MKLRLCVVYIFMLTLLPFDCEARKSKQSLKPPSIRSKPEHKDDENSCTNCDFRVLYHDMPKTRCYSMAQRYARLILLVNKKLNWFQANTFCRSHQMSLSTFKEIDKQLHIADKLKQHLCTSDNSSSVWTGLNNIEYVVDPRDDPTMWRGVNAEKLTSEQFNKLWDRTKEHNPTHSVAERCIGISFESCAELLVSSDLSHGKLNDANCYDEKRFICTKRYYI